VLDGELESDRARRPPLRPRDSRRRPPERPRESADSETGERTSTGGPVGTIIGGHCRIIDCEVVKGGAGSVMENPRGDTTRLLGMGTVDTGGPCETFDGEAQRCLASGLAAGMGGEGDLPA